MISIFSIPKPFTENHIGIIQNNAIDSWCKITAPSNIYLFGDEPGVGQISEQLRLNQIKTILKNPFGTPLLNDVFEKAHTVSNTGILCYVNCDIILTNKILDIIRKIQKRFQTFLIVGRRLDLQIHHRLPFGNGWEVALEQNARENGKIHGYSGIDYLIFPKPMLKKIPPFAVGRIGWDNWIIYHVRRQGHPVVDITNSYRAIHQQHDYMHLKEGVKQRNDGIEALENIQYAGGRKNMYTIRDANYILTPNGLRKNINIIHLLFRFFLEKTPLFHLYEPYIAIRRRMMGITN